MITNFLVVITVRSHQPCFLVFFLERCLGNSALACYSLDFERYAFLTPLCLFAAALIWQLRIVFLSLPNRIHLQYIIKVISLVVPASSMIRCGRELRLSETPRAVRPNCTVSGSAPSVPAMHKLPVSTIEPSQTIYPENWGSLVPTDPVVEGDPTETSLPFLWKYVGIYLRI